MAIPRPLSAQNLATNLTGFFGAVLVMWFGVFKLHLYDVRGTKGTLGTLVLGIDWLLIATFGFTLLIVTIKKRRSEQFRRLSTKVKLFSYLASSLVTIGLITLAIVIIFYTVLLIGFRNYRF